MKNKKILNIRQFEDTGFVKKRISSVQIWKVGIWERTQKIHMEAKNPKHYCYKHTWKSEVQNLIHEKAL